MKTVFIFLMNIFDALIIWPSAVTGYIFGIAHNSFHLGLDYADSKFEAGERLQASEADPNAAKLEAFYKGFDPNGELGPFVPAGRQRPGGQMEHFSDLVKPLTIDQARELGIFEGASYKNAINGINPFAGIDADGPNDDGPRGA